MIRFIIAAGISAAYIVTFGGLWDSMIHLTQGHWTLAPAHLLIIAATLLYVACGGIVLIKMPSYHVLLKRYMRIIVIGSAIVFVAIVGLDELWHWLVGFDQTGWSPPHLIFWAGMLIELSGLVIIARMTQPHHEERLVPPAKLLLACSAVALMLLFNFIEYDVPAAAGIAEDRPGFAYPVAGSFVFCAGLLYIATAIGRPGWTTVAAVIAWTFFYDAGLIVEQGSGISFIRPPFPLVVPALAIDGWLILVWRNALPVRFPPFFWGSLASCAVCYWSIVIWSAYIIRLPQQISGGMDEWVIWFFSFIPVMAFAVGYISYRLSRWAHP